MRISRDTALMIHHIMDQWLPPVVRDSRLIMHPLFKMLFGIHAGAFMDFKDKSMEMNSDEIRRVYSETASSHVHRDTDINRECLRKIEKEVIGTRVLDIACGRGYLAGRLAKRHQVTAADFSIDSALRKQIPWVNFREAHICCLPFADNEFDTVVCAHTLEHIPDIRQAVSELRRVARKRLVVVVPRQRPYRYTFDLHVHFFPYRWSLMLLMGRGEKIQECTLVGGDWFYVEDL